MLGGLPVFQYGDDHPDQQAHQYKQKQVQEYEWYAEWEHTQRGEDEKQNGCDGNG